MHIDVRHPPVMDAYFWLNNERTKLMHVDERHMLSTFSRDELFKNGGQEKQTTFKFPMFSLFLCQSNLGSELLCAVIRSFFFSIRTARKSGHYRQN